MNTTLETIKDVKNGYVITTSNKKLAVVDKLSVGEKIICFSNGLKSDTPPEKIKDFYVNGEVSVTKTGKTKVTGFALPVKDFI